MIIDKYLAWVVSRHAGDRLGQEHSHGPRESQSLVHSERHLELSCNIIVSLQIIHDILLRDLS